MSQQNRNKHQDRIADEALLNVGRLLYIPVISMFFGMIYLIVFSTGSFMVSGHSGTGVLSIGCGFGVMMTPFMLLGLLGKPVLKGTLFICLPTLAIAFVSGILVAVDPHVDLWPFLTPVCCIGMCVLARLKLRSLDQPHPLHCCQRCGLDLCGIGDRSPCPECGSTQHLSAGILDPHNPCLQCGYLHRHDYPLKFCPGCSAHVDRARCGVCGYDLKGLARGADCPECGVKEPLCRTRQMLWAGPLDQEHPCEQCGYINRIGRKRKHCPACKAKVTPVQDNQDLTSSSDQAESFYPADPAG